MTEDIHSVSVVDPLSEVTSNQFNFYTSNAFYLFIALICVFGVALIVALVSDILASNSTLVHPIDSLAGPHGVPSELKCSALIHLRNPVRLITLTTPNFSRFVRVLFYFTYVFFLYGLSGQLSQHIALFLAVGVIGGIAGLFINVLKGFYTTSTPGKFFALLFLLGGIAIDAVLMQLAPGVTNEEANNVWMMNAILAIIFDLVITDSIRPVLTLMAHSRFAASPFARYFFDNVAVKAFIESRVVKPQSASSYDNVKHNQSFSVLDQSHYKPQHEMAPIRGHN